MDEKELIKQTLQGKTEAFDQLVEPQRETIFRHCLSLVKDEEAAQDLTQEAFLHAFQHLSSFRMQARFSTWLWRIAHNLSLNYLKKHRHPEEEFKEAIYIPSEEKEDAVDEEHLEKLYAAMQILSPEHRIVFEMYVFQHLSQKQIAKELGIPYGTVRSRMHYARKQVKHVIHPKA